MTDPRFQPPTEVDGTSVEADMDNPAVVHGETWVTLIPDDEYDGRLWEFSLTTGRIVLTMEDGE